MAKKQNGKNKEKKSLSDLKLYVRKHFEYAEAPLCWQKNKIRFCFLLLAVILSLFFAAKLLELVVWAHSLHFLSTHTLLKVSNLVAPTSFHSGHSFEGRQALYSQPLGLSSVLMLLDCLAYFDAINHFPLLQPWNQKTFALWKKSCDKPRQHIKKQRHYFANKCLYSQGYGFSRSHVWMWELDHKEGWAPKNWCFWTVVLEKTFEIKPVSPKGKQSWIFIGRTNAEAPILWLPDVKSQLIGK